MIELLRSNDLVLISFVASLLQEAAIETHIFDQHTSIIEGSVGAIPRRVMVDARDAWRARQLLQSEGIALRD